MTNQFPFHFPMGERERAYLLISYICNMFFVSFSFNEEKKLFFISHFKLEITLQR